MEQTDLFGEPRISIKDNPILEKAANRLLLMFQRDGSLLEGKTVGAINRKIYAELLWEDGLQQVVSPDKKQAYMEVMSKAPEGDVYTRALRYLVEKDLARLPASAIRDAERFRAKIAGAMK